MQVYTNEPYIKRRARIGQYVSWGGLAVLLAGAIISFTSTTLFGLSFIALAVGFVAANIGSFYMRRFVRKPRPDELISNNLKGLDKRYEFFAWQLPAPNVLLGPAGLYVFVTRDQDGQVKVNGDKWRQPFKVSRLLTAFSQEALGNPAKEAAEDAARVETFIKKHRPELEVSAQPVVVFINPKVSLDQDGASVPVLLASDLKEFIRRRAQDKAQRLNDATRKEISTLFGEAVSAG